MVFINTCSIIPTEIRLHLFIFMSTTGNTLILVVNGYVKKQKLVYGQIRCMPKKHCILFSNLLALPLVCDSYVLPREPGKSVGQNVFDLLVRKQITTHFRS